MPSPVCLYSLSIGTDADADAGRDRANQRLVPVGSHRSYHWEQERSSHAPELPSKLPRSDNLFRWCYLACVESSRILEEVFMLYTCYQEGKLGV